jgi:hypothetical protein
VALGVDEYRLENLSRDHAVAAGMFLPFAIQRLQGERPATEAVLEVSLRDIETVGEVRRQLRLLWSPESAARQPLAVQPHTVTEWAAFTVACAVVLVYGGLRVREVAAYGDRFDTWVEKGGREYGLEISGTITEEVEARHRAKVEQLLGNPYLGRVCCGCRIHHADRYLLFSSFPGDGLMNEQPDHGINRGNMDPGFQAEEARKSNLLLEAQLLRAQRQDEAAAEKFAEAARIEERLSEQCFAKGLLEKSWLHQFSAASSWAQAGNFFLAIVLCQQLLARFDLPDSLRQSIRKYADKLQARRAVWYADLELATPGQD